MEVVDGLDTGVTDDGPSSVSTPAWQQVLRIAVAAPDRILIGGCWFAIVVALAVILGQFRPAIVLPAAVIVIALTWRTIPPAPRPSGAAAAGAVLAIVLAAGWVLSQLQYATQYLVVTRDPGFLTLGGVWLSEHPSRDMAIGAAAQVDLSGMTAAAPGYTIVGDTMYSQGASMLPGLLGAFGWLGGIEAVLAANLVLAGWALLSLYALARRLMGPLWALLPMAIVGVSMPMLYFSRAAYTEPFTMALAFAGLTMALAALSTGRRDLYAAAGVLFGATAMLRIDGAAIAIGVVVGFALIGLATLRPDARRSLVVGLAWLIPSMCAGLTLGYLDLRLHSPQYLIDLSSLFFELTAVLVVTVLALGVSLSRRAGPVRELIARRRGLLAGLGAAAVCLIGAGFALRPFISTSHRSNPATSYNEGIKALQSAEGLPLDPTRTYDEMTLHWIAWYYGWILVALGVAGLAALIRLAILRRDPRPVLVCMVVAAPTLLYLYQISVSPDQIWAVRRLLPLSIPGLALAAVYLVSRLAGPSRRSWRSGLAALIGLGLLVRVLTIWPVELYQTRELDGRSSEIHQICDAITSTRVLYLNKGGTNFAPTLKVVCGVDVVRMNRVPSQWLLQQLWLEWGGEVSVVFVRPDDLPLVEDTPGVTPDPLVETDVRTWQTTLMRIPSTTVSSSEKVWVGSLTPAGMIRTVP